jgi:putative oligomerization/nucleic acid binding protein
MPANDPVPAPAPPKLAAEPQYEDRSIVAALDLLRGLLVAGESLQAYAVQRRLFALTHRRVIVGATSGRFMALTRHLFGGYTLADVRWQDLHDAGLNEGIFGADLTITSSLMGDLASADKPGQSATYMGLRKEEARRVYRVCQGQEQAWREKRRVRDLDEMRARSGGIQLGANAAPFMSQPTDGADDPGSRLKRAKEMLDGGLITDAEYEAIKARIVERL